MIKDLITDEIIGTVNSVADKWVVTTLSNEPVKIAKSGLDLLEDEIALADIRDVVSHALGNRTDAGSEFQHASYDSSAANSGGGEQQDDGSNNAPQTGDQNTGDAPSDSDDAPIAGDDVFTIDEDGLLGGNVIRGGGAGGADVDPDGFAVTVTQVNGAALTFGSDGWSPVVSLPLSADALAAAELSGVTPPAATVTISKTGTIVFNPESAFNYLAVGETATQTFTYTIRDQYGFTDTATVTVTIEGRNDTAVITGATNPVSIAETLGDSSAQDIAPVTGTITVIDPDFSDTLTLSVTGNATATYNGGAVPVEDSVDISALIASGAISFDVVGRSNGQSHTVNWTYDPTVADLDWLRVGDTLTITYVAQVDDGHGNVGAQNLVITITGTNDNPYISGSTSPASILEVLGDSSAQDIPPAHGTITFSGATDQDLGDTLTLSVTGNATAAYNGGVVPTENSVDIAALIASGAITFAPIGPSNGESQTVNWTYNPTAADLDWLREGDTLTITYVAQIDDGHGTLDTENLVITITGTNDVPVIESATNPASIGEIAGDSSAQDIAAVTGTITVSDQDLGDTLTFSVTGNATARYNGGVVPTEDSVDVSALIASGAISFDALTSDGETQTINWTYNPDAADLDWLREGDTLTITYVAQVDDGHGNVGAQDLVITITGTNDVPVIESATDPASIGRVYRRQFGPGHRDRHRHDHGERPGSGRHVDPQRHRQCNGRIQWRCSADRGELRRYCRADRQWRHPLRSAHFGRRDARRSTGPTIPTPPISTGCARAIP